jgi:hypothetical protein
MWDASLRGSEFLQLSPLRSIIAGAARTLRLRSGYSRLIPAPFAHQFPASEKFTVIWVSTSTGSLFRMYGR